MKWLLALVLIVVSVSANAIISVPYSNAFDNTGTLVFADKVHIMVKNAESSSIARGKVVIFSVSADNGATVTLPTAGVALGGPQVPACVTDEAIAAGAIGKCLVYGYHDAIYFDQAGGTAVAGQPMYMGSDYPGNVIAVASASSAGYQKVGSFFDASSASGTVEGFVKAL